MRYDAYNPSYQITLPDRGVVDATECAKLACAFFDDIFGANAPIREIKNPEDVRPGDLIWTGSHWFIATMRAIDYKGRGPHTQEIGGGSSGIINWMSDGYINISSGMKKMYTRYPE